MRDSLFSHSEPIRNQQLVHDYKSMESAGNTESWFYLRARASADNPNPISNEAELL